MKKDLLDNLIVQIGYSSIGVMSWGFIIMFFLAQGYSIVEILIYYLLLFITASIATMMMKEMSSKTISLSLFFRIISFLLVTIIISKFQIYLVAIAFGIFIPLFWITYKVIFFGLSEKGKTATNSSIFSSIYPILKLFLPVIGGYIISELGYPLLFSFSVVVLIFVAMKSLKNKTKKYEFDYKSGLRKTRKLNLLVFIEGVGSTMGMILIPFITLEFLTQELNYGLFLSLTSIFGVIAAFIMAKNSDKKQERVEIIYPFAIIRSIAAIVAAFTNSLYAWALLIGLYSFSIRILNPFHEVVVIDHKKHLADSMHARELMINVGRVVGVVFVLASYLLFNNLRIPLIVVALITLAYPILLSKLKLYKDSASLSGYLHNKKNNVIRKAAKATGSLIPKGLKKKSNDKLHNNWTYKNKKIK